MELAGSWFNGVAADSVSIQSRGLAYGDGVFETVLCCGNKPQHWERHVARLREGCARLQLDGPADLDAQVATAMQATSTAFSVLKIMVIRAEVAAGYAFSSNDSDTIISVAAYQATPTVALNVGIASQCLAVNPQLAGIKHLSRIEQTMAAAEAQREALDDLLMLDTHNNIIEAVSSNVFFKLSGQWCTPALNNAGVAGVMRAYFLEEFLSANNIDCKVCDIPLTALQTCESAFVTNSLKGPRPIGVLNGVTLNTEALSFLGNIKNNA